MRLICNISFHLSMNPGSAGVPPARRARMHEPAAETAALPGNRWRFKGSMREDWFRRILTPALSLGERGKLCRAFKNLYAVGLNPASVVYGLIRTPVAANAIIVGIFIKR